MLRRLASVVACAFALTVLGSANAQAATRAFVDGPGDVWTVGQSPNARIPNRDQGDILRTTLRHEQQQIVVRHKFAELKREGRRIVVFTRLRTNTGTVMTVRITARRQNWEGRIAFERRDGEIVPCRVAANIDYATNVAVVRVARRCIDNPRTVQAKVGVATTAGQHTFADNPINHGPTQNLPRYTAPVRVG